MNIKKFLHLLSCLIALAQEFKETSMIFFHLLLRFHIFDSQHHYFYSKSLMLNLNNCFELQNRGDKKVSKNEVRKILRKIQE